MSSRSNARIAALVVSLVVLGGCGKSPPASSADHAKFQGDWYITSVQDSGNEDMKTPMHFAFAGDQAISWTKDRTKPEFSAEFRLDTSKSPKWLDFNLPDGRTHRGIYEFEGDELRLCFSEKSQSAADRSTEFKSEPKSHNDVLLVLRRKRS